MAVAPSYCWRFGCKHYQGVEGDEPHQVTTCAAFPNGIPQAIDSGDEFHSEPIPGDNDIQFEVDPSLTPKDLHDRMFGDLP